MNPEQNDKVRKYSNDDYSRFAGKNYKEHSGVFDEANYYNSRQSSLGGIDLNPDKTISDEAYQILLHNPSLDASAISLSVHDSVISLSGLVDDRAMKDEAEACLRKIPGVLSIVNKLQIRI